MRKAIFILLLCANGLLAPWAIAQEPAGVEELMRELEAAETAGDKSDAARLYNKIGFSYWSANQPNEAIPYFSKSLQYNQSSENLNGAATLHNYLGLIYSDLRNFDLALQHLENALELRRKLKDKRNEFSELLNIAVLHRQKGDHAASVPLTEKALELGKEMNDIVMLRRCYGMLAEAHESLKNTEKSIEYYNLFATLDKEIRRQEQQRMEADAKQKINLAEQKTRAALTEKELKELELQKTEQELVKEIQVSKERQLQIELLNKENEIKELQVARQEESLQNERLLRNTILAALAVMFILAGFIFRALRQKQKANLLLAKKNREINAQKERIEGQQLKIAEAYVEIRNKSQKINRSIVYARRIQQAMLSHWDKVYDSVLDSFVFFKPRDIVSGDFYYFREIDGEQPKYVIAAVDCTGHGVPGAFMSMIATELLHEIIDLKKVHSPHLILSELHAGIRQSLKQGSTKNKDGMDISLVVYDPASQTIEFAAARNPLIYFQNGKMTEIKGDRQSIGGIPDTDHKTFSNKTIRVEGSATFYLFTDGFQDQFGGIEGEKLLPKNFKKLLCEIHQLSWKEQNRMLETQLHRWQGSNFPQIDDILIIGFRVGENGETTKKGRKAGKAKNNLASD